MNTININKHDLKTIMEYEYEYYFENFIFNDFKVVVKRDDYKVVYLVHINKDITKMTQTIIYNGLQTSMKLTFKDEGENINLIEVSGKTMEAQIKLVNQTTDEEAKEKIKNSIINGLNAELAFITQLRQYIMNESYKRSKVTKISSKKANPIIEDSMTHKVKKNKKDDGVVFLLSDVINYVSCNRSGHTYMCPCWTVRGHFRHYKNGIVKWIDSFEKGKQRGKGKPTKDKIYSVSVKESI